MAGARPVDFWDTCLFLAWLNDEARKSGVMDGVREVIARHKLRDVRLITSVLTRVGVLQSEEFPVGVGSSFTDLLKRLPRLGMDLQLPGFRRICVVTIGGLRRIMAERFLGQMRFIWRQRFTAAVMSFSRSTMVSLEKALAFAVVGRRGRTQAQDMQTRSKKPSVRSQEPGR